MVGLQRGCRDVSVLNAHVEDWTYVNLVFVERAWIVIWNEASAYVRTWKEIAESTTHSQSINSSALQQRRTDGRRHTREFGKRLSRPFHRCVARRFFHPLPSTKGRTQEMKTGCFGFGMTSSRPFHRIDASLGVFSLSVVENLSEIRLRGGGVFLACCIYVPGIV